MAKNVVETQGEQTDEVGNGATRGQGRRGRNVFGVGAALLAVVLLGSAALHDWQTRYPFVASEQRECTHPTVGFPTCYVQQADGTWAREELADVDAEWVVVGTVTTAEMNMAIGGCTALGKGVYVVDESAPGPRSFSCP